MAQRIGYLDCYSGVSGDMLLGAIVDAGVSVEALRSGLAPLGLDDRFGLEAVEVSRAGLRATRVTVTADGTAHGMPMREIDGLVRASHLPAAVRDGSLAVLTKIASVEARIHGSDPADVELHELGSIDTIVDVVGTLVGLELLGVDGLHASPLPVGGGSVSFDERQFPLPAPATLALLADANAPTRPFGDGHELVTPTGAALVTSLATFMHPEMRLESIGYGAGAAELPWPNVLRLWVGQPVEAGTMPPYEYVVLATNIDDMSPELLAPVTDRLLRAGALDVTVSAVQMKKGRAAVGVEVVARMNDERALADLLLRETSTLGVRTYPVRRHEAGRELREVETPYGVVVVKLKTLEGFVVAASPEFESVRAAAEAHDVPMQRVHAAAVSASEALLEEIRR